MAHRSRLNALALAICLTTSGVEAQTREGGLDAAFRPRARPTPLTSAANLSPEQRDEAAGLRVVVTGRKRAVAAIDGRLVHVGDELDGRRVARIDASGVVLADDEGNNERLPLAPATQRRPTVPTAAKGANR